MGKSQDTPDNIGEVVSRFVASFGTAALRLKLLFCALAACCAAFAAGDIFPKPQGSEGGPGAFLLDASVIIALPPMPSAADRALAALLSAEVADRFQLAWKTLPLESLRAGQRYVAMGSVANAWIRKTARERQLDVSGTEGYGLEVTASRIVIAGRDDAGAFYGLQSLRQLLGAPGRRISGLRVRDWPASPFRAIKMYLPGRDNIPFFKRFVRDFMAQYKFNRLILEMNAGMRLDRHPEVNAGWLELGRDLFATRRERTSGPHGETQDSVHHDTADGGILEKAEVAELADWARQNHIQVIPEIPSLTHSYYLLARHRELAEIPDAEWPDTYCPLQKGSYSLLFDVLDEYIDVLKPAVVHIGHDEWRIPWGSCPRCREQDPRELFATDVNRIYAHLKEKGVRTAMWGDHLIEGLRGVRVQDRRTREGYRYQVPGALSPEQVQGRIPKDILVFNWFWDDRQPGQGEVNDRSLSGWGFEQVYGNMTPRIPNYSARSARKGVIGGAPSSWAATTPSNFGKDLIDQFLGCAEMLWARDSLTTDALYSVMEREVPHVEATFRGPVQWSALREPVIPVALPTVSASPAVAGLPPVKSGKVQAGSLVFHVGPLVAVATRRNGPSDTSPAIAINQDASSLVFLHASASRGQSRMSYALPHDFDDTADLLGWYEIVYDDGLVITVPIRTEVNILDWDRAERKGEVAYPFQATAVDLDPTVTFYAWEWANPRMGKTIREVRLHGSSGFKRADGSTISNGVILAGVSYVPKREFK